LQILKKNLKKMDFDDDDASVASSFSGGGFPTDAFGDGSAFPSGTYLLGELSTVSRQARETRNACDISFPYQIELSHTLPHVYSCE